MEPQRGEPSRGRRSSIGAEAHRAAPVDAGPLVILILFKLCSGDNAMDRKAHCNRIFVTRATNLVMALIMVVTLAGPGTTALGRSMDDLPSGVQPGYASGVILVGLKPGVEARSIFNAEAGKNAPSGAGLASLSFGSAEAVFTSAQPSSAVTGAQAADTAASPLSRIYRLHLPAGADVSAAVAALSANPGVAFAEPDYIARPSGTPNDTYFSDQWALTKIGAPSAWDHSTGDTSVVIAIVDSGLDMTHQDLSGQLWTNSTEAGGTAGVDDDGNGYIDDLHGWNFLAPDGGNNDLSDENGHGTQVAGVAGATTNNSAGIAGMCWNCRLMVVKVMQTSGAVNYSDIAAGIAYAASQGAQVINLSLGGYADSATLRTAIESAAATSVIVAGAGNDNKSTLFYPASYPDVIAVASSDTADAKASFSNFGAWVDITAPGVNIKSTFAGGNSYGSENGTSMSAPFVAGVAGLVRSLHADWSPALIRQQILNTAASIDGLNPTFAGKLGYGRLDALAALTTAPQAKMAMTNWAIDGTAGARPAPGQSFDLALTLTNLWLPARGVVGTLSTTSPYVTSVSDTSGAFGDLNSSQSRSNSADTFHLSLLSSTPYNQAIPFTLSLSGSDGYALVMSFSLQVRSDTEVISGGASYTINSNQTWTNDKTYLLKTNVIVAAGKSLTIQPGTLIKIDASKWIRVDGELVADGSEQSPIIFTSGSITNTYWSALRFTDTASPAVFDYTGSYISGSIIRHVRLSYADAAVRIGAAAPYIADSEFTHNNTAIDAGGSEARIERNDFAYNTTGITLNNGQAQILQNHFTANSNGISGNGSPTIRDNDFTGNTGAAISFGWSSSGSPLIHKNRIVGNGGGVNLSGLKSIDFQYNLIANNGYSTGCAMPP
ncbi:MAG: hypothetical protein EHM39_00845, partial [Chloroflexi bacterium]